jgi:hypothetical protein
MATTVISECRRGRGKMGLGDTFECFEEMIALKDCVIFSSMPWKFSYNTHQTFVRPFRTFPTIG